MSEKTDEVLELREGQWYWSSCSDRPLKCVGTSEPIFHTEEGENTYPIRRFLEPLPISDPRHPDFETCPDPREGWELCDECDAESWYDFHDKRWKGMDWDGHHDPARMAYRRRILPQESRDDWRRRSPSHVEVDDDEACLATMVNMNWKRFTVPATGRSVRYGWGNHYISWKPLPDPDDPPCEPPKGWVDVDEEDEATWPTDSDADEYGQVLVECDDRSMGVEDVARVRQCLSGVSRWLSFKWLREVT